MLHDAEVASTASALLQFRANIANINGRNNKHPGAYSRMTTYMDGAVHPTENNGNTCT